MRCDITKLTIPLVLEAAGVLATFTYPSKLIGMRLLAAYLPLPLLWQ
ncbi:RNA polymerase subunit sigma-70 [Yersinia enterocolitica]|nr:RNA polymerase subunit sigma-70 [Yersinia enterocolitica]